MHSPMTGLAWVPEVVSAAPPVFLEPTDNSRLDACLLQTLSFI